MNNYLCINGQKIPVDDSVIDAVKSYVQKTKIPLADATVGSVVKIGDYEFVVLEHLGGGKTALILKGLLKDCQFGPNNNFDGSKVETVCDDFYEKLCEIVGESALTVHTVDLISDDGLKDYGRISKYVSILTADQYRKYVEILDKHNPEKWWWLATPWTTKRHGSDRSVKCVSPSGVVNYGRDFGVRPFCILKSNIFVSQ